MTPTAEAIARGRSSRNKGRSFEQWLVREAKEAGLEAKRNPQFRGLPDGADVVIEGLRCECKSHAQIVGWSVIVSALLDSGGVIPAHEVPKAWCDWVAQHDVLVVKQTNFPRAAVLAFDGETGIVRVIGLRAWLRGLKQIQGVTK